MLSVFDKCIRRALVLGLVLIAGNAVNTTPIVPCTEG